MSSQPASTDVLLSCVRQAQKKEPGAFERLYDLSHERVFRFCIYLSGDREGAEEMTQETFVKAYSSLSDLREPERFLSWIMIIARRLFIDSKRRSGREKILDGEELERVVDQDLTDVKKEEILAVQATLADLAADDRVLLLMVHLEGHSYDEVGQVLGITEDQVRSKLRTARRRFMKKFDET